jgi:hypothetical protein
VSAYITEEENMYREHSVMDYSSVTLTGQMELDEEGN